MKIQLYFIYYVFPLSLNIVPLFFLYSAISLILVLNLLENDTSLCFL